MKTDIFIKACNDMNARMIASQKSGAKWAYYNSKTSSSFEKALADKNYRVNCATTPVWALKTAGIIPLNLAGFYGEKNSEIKWKSAATKVAVEKECTVITIGGKKTVSAAIKDGTIKAGDIVTYVDIRHTNVYLGNGKWLDSGHAYSKGSGDGATFSTWIGKTVYGSRKIGSIIRLKEDSVKPVVKYRVQIGAYKVKKNADAMAVKAKEKWFDCIVKLYGDYWVVQCGIYTVKTNADALVNKLKAAGFSAAIVKM